VLASFVIMVRVDHDVTLQGLGGEALHGLYCETLRRHDPAFAVELHNLKGEKPFSLSGILTDLPKHSGRIHLRSRAPLEFRVCLLTDEVIEHSLAAFAAVASSGQPLRLGTAATHIQRLTIHPGTHPLVRSTSYPTLLQKASEEHRITLQFVSPTSFRAGDVQDLLPRPEQVFGSLFRAWQAFSPVVLPLTPAETQTRLRVSEYELRTELIHFARYKVIGFKGQVTFSAPRDADMATRQAINALADFAFFAGVGYKTTMGLGQTLRPLSPSRIMHSQTERR
jgi:CRISPR-associated endoribonuclease Cas6